MPGWLLNPQLIGRRPQLNYYLTCFNGSLIQASEESR
jgi:hypothetical protein